MVDVAEKLCRRCQEPLSKFLVDVNADYHIACFPEDRWDEWIGGYRDAENK